MATLLSDNFDRANSTTVIGSPQIGPAPVVQSGVGGITANRLYCSTASLVATYDLGTANVELTATGYTMNQYLQIVLGYVGPTDYYIAAFLIGQAPILWKYNPGGLLTLCTSNSSKVPVMDGSVCTAHHRDGVVRAYVDGVLVYRYLLDAPITSTLHGIRMSATTVRADNLLGTDAPVINEPVKPGGFRPVGLFGGPEKVPAAFVYRGRDTKIQDTTAGA